MQELIQQFVSHPVLLMFVVAFCVAAALGFLWLLITRLPKLIVRVSVGAALLVIFAAIIISFTQLSS